MKLISKHKLTTNAHNNTIHGHESCLFAIKVSDFRSFTKLPIKTHTNYILEFPLFAYMVYQAE